MSGTKLIIVESPAKCKTISKYAGDDYRVVASYGHIRDLAKSGPKGFGVDVEHQFAPTYTIDTDKKKVVEDLKADAQKSAEVILATDPDREGEAIAWHLAQVLGLDPMTTKRLAFNEITRSSVESTLANPRSINMNLVHSQETRRILDRIIGFELSKLMQRKIGSPSAGRVQSATLKLIVDHEKEIVAFVPEEYWTLEADIKNANHELNVEFNKLDGKTFKLLKEADGQMIQDRLNGTLTVSDIKKQMKTIKPGLPFTTSTLQQESFSRFHYATRKTQSIAQRLYEGVEINGEYIGLITYMRTDATRLSTQFIFETREFIKKTHGESYLGNLKDSNKTEKKSEFVQDAHEAIRPTAIARTPESIKDYLTSEQYNLYSLIYNRAMSHLMADKKEEHTVAAFESNGVTFKTEGVVTVFPGFDKVYRSSDDENKKLPLLALGDEFKILALRNEQHYTKPPARYSEGRVVRLMEENGIGRPSTYASTIETLKTRGYIESCKGIINPTEVGKITIHVLDDHFANLVDAKYTAKMEHNLDEIADGAVEQATLLADFYPEFETEIEKGYETIVANTYLRTGQKCPECGHDLVLKHTRDGRTFIGCSNYPQCKFVLKTPKECNFLDRNCPKCGSPLVERVGPRGKKFIGCSAYPKCDYIESNFPKKTNPAPLEPTGKKCPKCGADMVYRNGKYGRFMACSNFPKCRYIEKAPQKP